MLLLLYTSFYLLFICSSLFVRLISMDMDKSLREVARDGDEDVWYSIFNHCSLRDCIRMGAVCKSWLSVSKWSLRSRPPQLPWLMVLSSLGFNKDPVKQQEEEWEEGRRFISLSDDTMYDSINFPEIRGKRCCASFMNADARARGWLMIIDEESLGMTLFHPWRRIQLELPCHPFPQPPFYLHGLQRDCPPDRIVKWMKVIKAAMSDDASVVVVVFHSGESAFCRVTDDDKVWTSINISRKLYCDVIYHKGKFYVMAFDGGVGVIHINTTNPYVETLMEDHTIRGYESLRTYLLVDSASESLFIFVRNALSDRVTFDTVGFKVYELELDETGNYKKNPVEVESLGDRIGFLGQNSSMLVMASQFPGFKGNCIYFTDDIMTAIYHKPRIKCLDFGIFNMEDKTVKLLFRDTFHHNLWQPIWIAPPL